MTDHPSLFDEPRWVDRYELGDRVTLAHYATAGCWGHVSRITDRCVTVTYLDHPRWGSHPVDHYSAHGLVRG